VKVLDFGTAKATTLGEANAQVAALTREVLRTLA
jgi:hypothetical protein